VAKNDRFGVAPLPAIVRLRNTGFSIKEKF